MKESVVFSTTFFLKELTITFKTDFITHNELQSTIWETLFKVCEININLVITHIKYDNNCSEEETKMSADYIRKLWLGFVLLGQAHLEEMETELRFALSRLEIKAKRKRKEWVWMWD